MANKLLSGPAGAGKSQEAAAQRQAADGLMVISDFQSIYAALTGDQRGPDGRYPLRDDRLLPITEHLRREVIDAARAADIEVIATNSDGDRTRRSALLDRLGPAAVEEVIDPGVDEVKRRLSDRRTGKLSAECGRAINRWYSRLTRLAGGGQGR